MFERKFEEMRSITKYFKTSGYDDACTRSVKLGKGTYNEVFTTTVPTGSRNADVVVRLSFYNNTAIRRMNTAIENFKKKYDMSDTTMKAKNAFEKLGQDCRKVRNRDPVQIKNSLGTISNFFIERDVSPHFVYLFFESDCKKMTEKMPADEGSDGEPKYLCNNELGRTYNNVSFIERFTTDLSKLIMEGTITEAELKCVIFQVIYSLCAIQHYIPDFRHNDLSCANVLVKILNQPKTNHCYGYKVYDKKFFVPKADCRVFAAVYDFDLSYANSRVLHVSEKHAELDLRNDIIRTKHFSKHPQEDVRKLMVPLYNPSFDVHYFLWTLAWYIQKGNKASYPNIQNWIVSLGVIPNLQVDVGKIPRYTPQIVTKLIPVNTLASPFFEDYRNNFSKCPVDKIFSIKPLPIKVFMEKYDEWLNWPQEPETFNVSKDIPPTLYSSDGPKGSKVRIFDFKPSSAAAEPLFFDPALVSKKLYPHPIPTVFDFNAPNIMSKLDAKLIARACSKMHENTIRIISRKFGMNHAAYKNTQDLCRALKATLRQKYPDIREYMEEGFINKDSNRCSLFFGLGDLMTISKEMGVPEKDLMKVDRNGKTVPKRKQDICDILRSKVLTSFQNDPA